MKKSTLLFLANVIAINIAFSQGTAINSTGNPADNSAMLDVNSSNMGMLIPRVGLVATNNPSPVTSPAISLLVYNDATINDVVPGYYYWNGAAWVHLATGVGAAGPTGAQGATGISGNTGATGPVGCGTANTVIKSSGTSAVCSQITDNASSVGINNASPSASAILDVSSTTKGMLVPRMTTTERNAIVAPAHALMIYNLTTNCLEIYNSNISQWASGFCIGCQLPGTFTATNGSNITSTSFTANWNASAGATTYYLDVSTDALFGNFLASYNNLNVGNVTTCSVTGLTASSVYYYRVRANNSCGTSANSNTISVNTASAGACGGLTTMTDARDSKVYNIVSVGNQCWMAQNLNYSTSGALTPVATGQGAAGTQKYCYADQAANCAVYGGYYEWAEVMNGAVSCNGSAGYPPCASLVQGVCPVGWHIPSHYEFTLLEKNSGSNPGSFPYDVTTINWLGTDEGKNLKETGCTHWVCGGTNGTNTTAWTALGGGFTAGGGFQYFNDNGNWWSCTDYDANNAWFRGISYLYGTVYRDRLDKMRGHNVRCVKN